MSRLRPGPLYQGTKPTRDADYTRFIKRLPCVACLRTWCIDPAHTGPHGIGQKASDYDALPGCPECHRELHRLGPVRFQIGHGDIDFKEVIAMLHQFYQWETGRVVGEDERRAA